MDKEMRDFPPVSFDEFPQASYEEWKAEAVKLLGGGEFDKKLLTKTFEGITLQPIYTRQDVNDSSELAGQLSFSRGINPEGYLDKTWETSQSVIADTPEQAYEIIKEEIDGGTTSIRLHLSNAVKGVETGENIGVDMLNYADVKTTFNKIDLAKYGLNIDCGPSALGVVCLLAAAKSCFPKSRGYVGANPLGFLAKEGELPRALSNLYDEMAQTVKFTSGFAPELKTVLANGEVYANGGSDCVTELACVMGEVSEYLSELTSRGVDIDVAAKSIALSLTLGSNFFMEIAKLRAARVLFAHVVKAFGGSEDAQKATIFAVTSRFNKTVYDPYVNILRTTTESFSGVVGGAQSIQVMPFDEEIGRSDSHSRRIARNISIMMAEEFDLRSPVDPVGGSWYVETLTNQVVDAAWKKFEEFEVSGGFTKVLLSGKIQGDIEKGLKDKQSKLSTRLLRIVGVNMYANVGEKPLERQCKINKNVPKETVAYDMGCSYETSDSQANKAEFNCEDIIDSFKNEMSIIAFNEALNNINKEKGETCPKIEFHRLGEEFEQLRFDTVKSGGVKVFLANMGPIPQHKARAEFTTGFFEVGGFEIIGNDGFKTADEAVNAALLSKADVCVICSTDETYPELVPPIARGIKSKNPAIQVTLAGMPAPEYKDIFVEAGVDNFIHIRANCLEILRKTLENKNERGNGNGAKL